MPTNAPNVTIEASTVSVCDTHFEINTDTGTSRRVRAHELATIRLELDRPPAVRRRTKVAAQWTRESRNARRPHTNTHTLNVVHFDGQYNGRRQREVRTEHLISELHWTTKRYSRDWEYTIGRFSEPDIHNDLLSQIHFEFLRVRIEKNIPRPS